MLVLPRFSRHTHLRLRHSSHSSCVQNSASCVTDFLISVSISILYIECFFFAVMSQTLLTSINSSDLSSMREGHGLGHVVDHSTLLTIHPGNLSSIEKGPRPREVTDISSHLYPRRRSFQHSEGPWNSVVSQTPLPSPYQCPVILPA